MATASIRVATSADVPAITAMYRFDGFFHAWGDTERAAWLFSSVATSGGQTLIATTADAVVGHLEYLHCHEAAPSGNYGHIAALEVRVDQRRRGIATELLHGACQRLRREGAERVEVVAEDERSAALYAQLGFRPRATYVDLDLAIPLDDLADAMPYGESLAASERPWETLAHIAGRRYPAVYSWARAFLAAHWRLPEATGCVAHRMRSGAVVFADPWLVHVFLHPETDATSPELWPLWLAAFRLRAAQHEGRVRTVLMSERAHALRLLERWPASEAEEFTLLGLSFSP